MFVNKDNLDSFIKPWLILMFILIIVMIIIGGLTRLTDSGLSITAWEIFSGILPPLTNEKWNFYFSEYKKIPEYQYLNFSMNLNEFKYIFYWEYFHRLFGRIIGLASILPLIYISIKYKILFGIKKYYSIFFLVCVQGFLGWFMVKSGLSDNIDVSHYRLSIHLSMALIILLIIFWFILDIFKIKKFSTKISNYFIFSFLFIIFLQINLGAFLAGLDGGKIYNTWPDMNGYILPDDVFLNDYLTFNSFDNPSIMQFYHRIFGYLIIIFLIIFNYISFKKKIEKKYILIFNLSIFLQILLGILTLINGVTVVYASLHQAGSIFVLSSYLLILYKNTN